MSRTDADWPPLWDDDPTPGDPEDVAELGRKLRKMAEMIDEQSRVIDALASVEGWDSEAGKSFHELAGGTADKLKKSFERYDEAAKAIGEEVSEGSSDKFASEMRRAQRKADKALSDYQEAKDAHELADREVRKITEKHPPGVIPAGDKDEYDRWVKKRDDAIHNIGSARKQVKEAREIYDDAGDKAARHIKNIVHHDAVRDPGGFMNFLADWADRLSNISAVLSVLAVICAFVPPLQFLVPILATLAVLTSAAALRRPCVRHARARREGRLAETGRRRPRSTARTWCSEGDQGSHRAQRARQAQGLWKAGHLQIVQWAGRSRRHWSQFPERDQRFFGQQGSGQEGPQ